MHDNIFDVERHQRGRILGATGMPGPASATYSRGYLRIPSTGQEWIDRRGWGIPPRRRAGAGLRGPASSPAQFAVSGAAVEPLVGCLASRPGMGWLGAYPDGEGSSSPVDCPVAGLC
jgi:hypothetical protein